MTPKTTKCRLSHRTLQAATAKYRRGGPPAVIARHSSSRERRGVHRHYTRRGEGCAIRPCSAFCSFFRHFCNLPLSRSCTLFRAVEVNVPRTYVVAATFFRATRCEVYISAYNDWLNYFDNAPACLGVTFCFSLEFLLGFDYIGLLIFNHIKKLYSVRFFFMYSLI